MGECVGGSEGWEPGDPYWTSAGGASIREGEDGATPLLPPPAEPVAAERWRIWSAIVAWEEGGARLDDDGTIVPIEGFRFQPLAPFFAELHAIVFPDEAVPPLRDTCPECDGKGCPACEGRGWRINPAFFGDESPAGGAGDE